MVDAVRLGWFEFATGFHLRKAQEASFAAFKRLVGGIDIRVGHFATLMLIGENPGINQTTLGRAVGRDKSSLTPILDDLVERGLVARKRSVQDRRRYGLTLTEEGEAMRATLAASATEHEKALAACVSPDDLAHFVRILKRIARIMPD
ncbi:MarR family transcriptional regulator [Verticiella sediminum]|uniref:MarR family transcriptional regulator n=2 Tax=Verticiella sediminum TaxID=1247510 RepID=A0A556B0J1_9BURK|nr:MarR family transcriptional regulator [Verticiella sediminum]